MDKRKKKLRQLIDEHYQGKISSLAKAADIDQTYLARCLWPMSTDGAKTIGVKIVDKISKLHPGWDANFATTTENSAPLLSWTEANEWESAISDARANGCLLMPVPAGSDLDVTYVLKVKDDANEPRVPSGSWIVVNGSGMPEHGNMIVVNTGGIESTLGELVVSGDSKLLKAVNARYPIKEMQPTFKVCGVVKQGYFN